MQHDASGLSRRSPQAIPKLAEQLAELEKANAAVRERAQSLLASLPPGDERRNIIMSLVQQQQQQQQQARSCVDPIEHRVEQKDSVRNSSLPEHLLFWLFTGVFAPVMVSVLAFAVATTMTSSGAFLVISAIVGAVLVLVVPAACAPEGPAPAMQPFVNFMFAFIFAVACHAVVIRWEETKLEQKAFSQLVRRGLVVSLALVVGASAILQWSLGRRRFWYVLRLCGVLCGGIRLLAILLLFLDGAATTYPPGALPFTTALAVCSVMPALAVLLTLDVRQRLARAVGLSHRIKQLQAQTKRWLPS